MNETAAAEPRGIPSLRAGADGLASGMRARVCGACLVWVNATIVRGGLMLAVQCDGCRVEERLGRRGHGRGVRAAFWYLEIFWRTRQSRPSRTPSARVVGGQECRAGFGDRLQAGGEIRRLPDGGVARTSAARLEARREGPPTARVRPKGHLLPSCSHTGLKHPRRRGTKDHYEGTGNCLSF